MEINTKITEERYAVVTGANKGIGFETVRRLASEGVVVVLTARDEKKGIEGTASLNRAGLTNVVFHQLDVLDPGSVDRLAKFIQTRFGKLDILINNAAASGVIVDIEGLKALNIDPVSWAINRPIGVVTENYQNSSQMGFDMFANSDHHEPCPFCHQLSGAATDLVQGVIQQTYETGKHCLDTNYYGCKRVTKALIPSLQRSTSGARIVNVSSLRGELKRIPNEKTRHELLDIDNLTEEKIDGVVQRFLVDLKCNKIKENGWSTMLPSYSISKQVLNAYTRVLAKQYPDICINCVHPGYVNTDLNWHTGTMTVEEGAQGPVMLALLPNGGPTGCYFDQTEISEF